MKHHQIEAFYQVMLTGSVSKAAQNLGRTQPAVSMTINALEDQLGTPLFDRQAGRVRPRAEAKILFEQIRPVMQQLADIRQRFSRNSTMAVPRISIIASNIAGMHLVPSAIANVAIRGQELRLMNARSDTIISEIENQHYDMGVTDEGTAEVPLTSPLFATEIFKIQLCAVFPPGLIEASQKDISIQDLVGHNICSLYEENRSMQEIKTVLGSVRFEFSSSFPMACFALISGSIAIVDRVTCSALDALTAHTLPSQWRTIHDIQPVTYYLLRPYYRPGSQMADTCYDSIRKALSKYHIA